MKKTIKDVEVTGKRVIVRCDFNVPQDEDGTITDDIRITSALPTINYLLENGAKLILMSHLGRPKDGSDMKYTLAPVAERLSALLKKEIFFISTSEIIDERVRQKAAELQEGEVLLLENLRFRKEETENESNFCKELASLAEIFVNDAFGTAHRAHCSTAGIAEFLPAVSGFLLEQEVRFMGDAIANPERPFVAIMGGAKVGDKIPVIENLIGKVDSLIIGGGMAYTFLAAKGLEIGKSLLEEDKKDLALSLLKKGEEEGTKILLPLDIVVAAEFKNEAKAEIVDADKMPSALMGLDIGPKTIQLFCEEIRKAKTVVWNGPMGVFEMPSFAAGTKAVAETMSQNGGTTVIGGGDSAAAVLAFGLSDKMTHISTGGGASLKLLAGKTLPGVAALLEK